MYNEVLGNLITRARLKEFDVIAHGCNCFCTMGAGIAPQMAQAFGCDGFELEESKYKGDIDKLGRIDYGYIRITDSAIHRVSFFNNYDLIVVNAYTQYGFGRNHKNGSLAPVDYEAVALCMRKMNTVFKGKHIGLPQIGAGLAGGDWEKIKGIIQEEFKDCDVTIVIWDGK